MRIKIPGTRVALILDIFERFLRGVGFKLGRELSIEILNYPTPIISVQVTELHSWTEWAISENPNSGGAKNLIAWHNIERRLAGEDSEVGAGFNDEGGRDDESERWSKTNVTVGAWIS